MAEKTAEVVEVDPARLCMGEWSHVKQRVLGKGDIAASYSAEKIAYGKPIRPPFHWQGMLMVNTSACLNRGNDSREAYRLIPLEQFEGDPCTYRERGLQMDAARCDPHGFYHGMIVTWRGRVMVLSGPPIIFIAGKPLQQELFPISDSR